MTDRLHDHNTTFSLVPERSVVTKGLRSFSGRIFEEVLAVVVDT